jgi:uncharacterized LabA/DUF88 family protein
MINLTKHAALLIDADNAQLKYVEQALKLAEYYGILDICRAYGDWKEPPLAVWCEKIDAFKIDRIQVNRVGKNATDHRLLVEAGEILASDLFTRDEVNVFIIVSGDGDFASACQLIRERGRQVIVIGSRENMSKGLRETCDSFHCLEDLNDELANLEKLHPISPDEVRAFWKMLQFVYLKFYETQAEWITLAELDNRLREVMANYESRFGKYKLSEWLDNFDWYLEISGQMIRKNPKYTRYALLANAYWETQRRSDSVSLPQLGKVLRELNPDYESLFGEKKLSGWLKDYPDVFDLSGNLVTLSSNRNPIFS